MICRTRVRIRMRAVERKCRMIPDFLSTVLIARDTKGYSRSGMFQLFGSFIPILLAATIVHRIRRIICHGILSEKVSG